MKIIATNIGKATTITWNGKQQSTGIYKYPTTQPILLQQEQVAHDTVADKRVHGGTFKACYLFSADQYPYWKEKYPGLEWDWGMFGENLTVAGLDENKLIVGSTYRIGGAVVQITQPREPCYKLGIRFCNQQILKEFIVHGHPGTYVRVLQNGNVKAGDTFELIMAPTPSLTTKQFFDLLFAKDKDRQLVKMAVENEALPLSKRERLKKYL
ncbi:MOSC domain-containing protein [Flagellimonas lutaonensis]|uniref:MOSC domain-containing protein n=1 Tax=Flagellimonas lutaonensis TaxID=516051 RepID=A0A0D5YVK2_9FLAO|nr:MOSC domain-containing protein [Allomuricauda lutaonensis]AKA35878.1 MOSC domain-containing protein [Allomuricauda lutaonensis]